jgi:predicted adenylyl cyclase CyaB
MSKVIGFEDFMNINNLKEFVVIEKAREKFRDNEFTYTFDDVKGFGLFIEIESMAMEGSDLERLKKKMKEKVSILNPKFIPVGYIEFFVREMDFNLYKQGMYLFDEDR